MRIDCLGHGFVIEDSLIEEPTSEIHRQVREYESGDRRSFDLSITYPDTFTGRVMEAMAEIPYGETRTYGDIAEAIDSAPVAVGGACGRNPIAPIVPCHRVVGHDSLGGYSAVGGLELKRKLLALESQHA